MANVQTRLDITIAAVIQKAIKVMNELEIKWSAIEIRHELAFLLSNGMDAEYLLEHYGLKKNDKRKSMNLLKALSNERKALIDLTKYDSFQQFKSDYEIDKQSALSRMFMEHFNVGKMSRVPDDLETLFRLHSLNRYARFMQIAQAS